MTIQAVGSTGVVLYFGPEEVPLEDAQLLRLIRESCHRAGLALTEPLEIEAYESGAGVLAFVRGQARGLWRFESDEALRAAVKVLDGEERGGRLYAGQGCFWLALSPCRESTQHRLSEFAGRGRALPRRALLLSQDALGLLRNQQEPHSGSMT